MSTPDRSGIDWAKIVQLRTPQKLKEMFPDAQFLFKVRETDYFQIGHTDYIEVAPEWNEFGLASPLVVIRAFWAVTLTAFRRVIERDADLLEVDDGSILQLPPALRLQLNCICHAEIRDFVTASGLSSSEMDLFDHERRWRQDGKGWLSIGSCFSVPRFTYYFRSQIPIPNNEHPFAARFDMRDDKRIKMLWTPTD